MSNIHPARLAACTKQCRLANHIEGKPQCIDRDNEEGLGVDRPGCPCEKFTDCHLGLQMSPKLDHLWQWFDKHDFFPDWARFYIEVIWENR